MSWWKRLFVPALLAASAVAPAQAQIGGHPFEVSASAGINRFDARDFIKDGPVFVSTLGYRWSDGLTWEGSFTGTKTTLQRPGEIDHEWSYTSLDARLTLRDPAEHATPYLLVGFGMGRSLDATRPILRAGAPSVGAGFLVSLLGNSRAYLRLQARDVMFRERDAIAFSHHLAATAGIQWALRGRPKDQDLDGVRNWLDRCPDTPIGAKVDATGCPRDSDGDGVFDGLDKCPDTPRGCKVDRAGCPTDADGDGVCDGTDKCADTPKGATVDATGCPHDADGDGVLDGLDKCPNTPAGATVDATGCPHDADGDGVLDGLDKCPNTPAGLKVDANGCPVEFTERETELLDTGMIRLSNVNFETAKADLLPESFPVLDEVGAILLKWPQLKIEIGGHTDSRGSVAYNQKLSEARMGSVKNYLVTKYPALANAQLTAKGYGELRPIAPNNNALNMAKNRRVEFVVQNKDVLKKEVEKRRLLQKTETAPADTTQKH